VWLWNRFKNEMGSGSSNLSEPQRAHVAKLMKENYEKIVHTIPEDEVQARMEKYYSELINSLKPPASLDGNLKDHGKKKTATRRRSFGDDKYKKKNLPPKPPPPNKTNSTVETAHGSEVAHQDHQEHEHHHHQDEAGQNDETGKSSSSSLSSLLTPPPPPVDSWDSVHSQPSCLLCNMVFATSTKYDTHIKYSEVHAQNLAKQNRAADGRPASAPHPSEPDRPSSAPPGPRCRELYTGSKFFWRYKQSIEIHIYLHLNPRCLEICSYNNNESREYPRVYLDEAKVIKLLGEYEIRLYLPVYLSIYFCLFLSASLSTLSLSPSFVSASLPLSVCLSSLSGSRRERNSKQSE
jgi:hypothetical protein